MDSVVEAEKYTIAEVVKACRTTRGTVHRWIRTGVGGGRKLKATKVGGRTMILKADLEAFIEPRESE